MIGTVVGRGGDLPLPTAAAARLPELSLEALYRDHAERIREFCARRLRSAADAEDACHETLLRAARAARSFRGEASVRWWLFVIARNVCADMAARRAQELPVPPLGPESAPTGPSLPMLALDEAERSAEEEAERRARVQLVREGLARLAPRDRAYLELREFRGCSYDEIGDLDGATEGAVRTRLTRARQRLRDHVEALAEHQRLWPVPVLFGGFGRLRSRWVAFRARFREQLVFDLSTGPGTSLVSLGTVLSPAVVQTAAALIGATGLALGTAGAVASISTDPSISPVAARSDVLDGPSVPTATAAPATAAPSPASAPAASPAAPPLVPQSPPTPESSPVPAVSSFESNAEEVAAEPVQRRGSDDADPGYETAPTQTSVDVDGDGEDEIDDTGPSAGLSCGSEQHHGPVTTLLCEATEAIP